MKSAGGKPDAFAALDVTRSRDTRRAPRRLPHAHENTIQYCGINMLICRLLSREAISSAPPCKASGNNDASTRGDKLLLSMRCLMARHQPYYRALIDRHLMHFTTRLSSFSALWCSVDTLSALAQGNFRRRPRNGDWRDVDREQIIGLK